MKDDSNVLELKDEAITGEAEKQNPVNIGEMLRLVGSYGRFQWMLDAVFCLMIIPCTYQILIMYFAALQPNWKCTPNSVVCSIHNQTFPSHHNLRCSINRSEWQFVESEKFSIVTQFDIYCDREWIIHVTTSIFFIGWAFGAVFMGWVADNYGRKAVLFPSMAICMIVGLLCPLMPNIPMLLICRFIVGFATPGTGVQMFILISEYVGSMYRPFAGIIIWFFFTIGLCILGLKAYFIRNWMTLYIVCTAPYIWVMLFYRFVPESARWLRLRGRVEEALEIFKRISKWNRHHLDECTLLQAICTDTISNNNKSKPSDLFKTSRGTMKTLIQGYAWLVNGMVYFGLSLAADDLGGNLYRNFVLVSIIEFPAVVFAVDFCARFGRKKTVSLSMLVAGIICIVVAFVPIGAKRSYRVVLGMCGKLCVTLSFDAIYTWSVELYPTDVRAQGMGFLQIASRIGAASAPWIAKGLKTLHESVPFIVMGVAALISAFLTLCLPETKDLETAETEDEENELMMSTYITTAND